MVLMLSEDDHLHLRDNAKCQTMLAKYGNNKPLPEQVLYSSTVLKINRKGKEQKRALLLTTKAMYNIDPSSLGKCKRRIDLDSIAAVSVSETGPEFVVHVPQEYDYRYKSEYRERVAAIISERHKAKTGHKLNVQRIAKDSLQDCVVTKPKAKLQSREERMRRERELAAEEHESDHEDMGRESVVAANDQQANSESNQDKPTAGDADQSDDTTQLIEGKEKVGLEDFEFLKVIGRGSFGKVMQVRKTSNGKIYAMKILKKNAIVARNQVEHTQAERRILQSLQHPFLMGLRFAFQTKGKLYFVLDYYRGGELFFHLKKKRRFTEGEARVMIAEVASALGHLHKLDIIYRDLKPENILLDHTGHLCLTDFGLSKDLAPETSEAHTFCGTPEYLAPEIVMGVGHGKSVDWWSLGILLYELCVGIPPFYSQNVHEMYHKIQHGVLRFPPFLSDPCKSLIIGLLNRDPEERLGSGVSDVGSIMEHEFFTAHFTWQEIDAKDVDPPYKPTTQGEADTTNFDKTFTNEVVVDSLIPESALNSANDKFGGFTFAPKSGLAGSST